MKGFSRLKIGLFSTILILYVILCGKEVLVEMASYVYLLQTAAITIVLFKQPNNRYYIFSPSYIALLYLNINFIIGHYTVSRGFGLKMTYYRAFMDYSSIEFITVFFLLCNLIVFLAIPFKKIERLDWSVSNKKQFGGARLVVLFAIIFILSFIQIDLSFIGGGGDFSYIYKLAAAIFIILPLVKSKAKWRFPLYLLLILLFTIGHFDSKREIIYVIILIVFLEIMYNKVNFAITFKQLFLGVLGGVIFFYIVMISSIMRGYGNYEPNSIGEAVKYVPEYIQSDIFKDAFTANFETNSVYGNSTNAINYIYDGTAEITYGSTFIKFLFLPIPRSVFPDKPNSMIENYTIIFDPQFRAIGGSYPVIVFSEVFWNFHIFGLLVLFFIFQGINRLYILMVGNLAKDKIDLLAIFLLFMYVTLLQFIRGSGFDVWLLYGVLSLPLSYIIIQFQRIKKTHKII